MVAAPAMTAIECIGETEVFKSLRAEWTELLAQSDQACIFLTWEWVFTWWEHLAEGRTLAIVTVRREGELIGLAPLCVRPRSLGQGHLFPVLEFLGSGFAGSDYPDVILHRDCAAEARQALAEYLRSGRLPIRWNNIKPTSEASAIGDELRRHEWTGSEIAVNTCPYIPLDGATWESYLASLSSDHRYNFNRKLRRLNRDFEVRFEAVADQQSARETLHLLIAQHNARWADRGGSDAFHTDALVAFHRDFVQAAFACSWLRLYALRLNGAMAASLYGFLYRDVFYFYQSGFDAAYTQYSVGLLTMGLAIQAAIADGAVEYDLLHGNESYKSHWASHHRDLIRLEAFPPTPAGAISRMTVDLARGARSLAARFRNPGGNA